MTKIEITEKIHGHIVEMAQSKGVSLEALDIELYDLIDSHLLDSLGILQLIIFLEKCFDIRILPAEMVIESFRTIELISSFVAKKIN